MSEIRLGENLKTDTKRNVFKRDWTPFSNMLTILDLIIT